MKKNVLSLQLPSFIAVMCLQVYKSLVGSAPGVSFPEGSSTEYESTKYAVDFQQQLLC